MSLSSPDEDKPSQASAWEVIVPTNGIVAEVETGVAGPACVVGEAVLRS
jgi:hypothetical protein